MLKRVIMKLQKPRKLDWGKGIFCLLLIFILIGFISISYVGATDYYVNATTGNDSLAGTSPATAWKTISKINAVSFSPGDNIHFERGETWREQLTIPSSGNSTDQITFDAYGSGNKPVISGADLITGWEANGTNIWNATLTTEPNQVFFNGTRGTEVAYNSIDAVNEWNWSSNVLRIYSTSDPDTAYTNPGIEASNRTRTVFINGKNYVIVENFILRYSNPSTAGSIYVNNAGNIVLNNLTVSDNMGFAGIYIEGTAPNNLVKNSTIYNTRHSTTDRGSGIILDGTEGNHTLIGNIIYSNEASGIKLGMFTGTANNTISNNTIYQNGAAGISLNNNACIGNIIENNIVYENGQIEPEYFGIDLFKVGNDNIVRYNIVHDSNFIGVGAGGIRFDGAPGGVGPTGNKAYYNLVYNERKGIYILDFNNTEVYNNVVYNSSIYGIHIHGANNYNNIVKNNIVSNATTHLIYNQDATNSTIDYNIYYPDGATAFNWNSATSNFNTWKTNSGQDTNSPTPADPLFTNASGNDFTLQSTSPAIDAGIDLGASYDDGLDSDSVWPNSVLTLDQDDYGAGWEIGAYVYEDTVNPTITFSCSPTSVHTGDTITCSCSASDDVGPSPTVSHTTNPSTSNTGTYTTTCTASDNSGNSASSSISYTVNYRGGGESSTRSTSKTYSWTKVIPGATTILKDFDAEIGIKQIQIELSNEAQDVKITVTKHDGKPAAVTVEKSGKVYKYLQIESTNLADNFGKATVTLQVEKSWLSSNGLDANEIALFRFDESENEWEELSTIYDSSDDTYNYYDIELTSFSYFVISEKEAERIYEDEVEEKESKFLWLYFILGLVIVIVILLTMKYWKNRQGE